MVKINTFFAEWWSGPTSADRQGQNTVNPRLLKHASFPECQKLLSISCQGKNSGKISAIGIAVKCHFNKKMTLKTDSSCTFVLTIHSNVHYMNVIFLTPEAGGRGVYSVLNAVAMAT
jgi:hypothetical protein